MRNTEHSSMSARAALVLVGAALLASGCNAPRSPNSPELAYSAGAGEAQRLQVPPDLTDVSDGEQFILPGNTGGKVTRNTLLPAFASARLVRAAGERWLEIDLPPESVWPKLQAFLRERNYSIEQTEPVAGTITTQWRPASAGNGGGVIRSLIGSDDQVERVGFRLERSGDDQTRLFSRYQSASEEESSQVSRWPDNDANPEETSALLARLLAFLGLDEQQRKGLLSESERAAVLSDAVLQSNTAGSVIVLHKGYVPAFAGVTAALDSLGYAIGSADDGAGRIETTRDDAENLIVRVNPVHASAVRVSVTNGVGRQLAPDAERRVLEALHAELV